MRSSALGKKLLIVFSAIFLVNIVVLALAARVNDFQEFFFVADLFPLALSIVTMVVLFFMFALDLIFRNSVTARPPFTIGLLSVLSIFWLAFNAFSTSRWRHVPLMCSSIPAGFESEKVWCQDLQALKAFVWIEWLLIFCTAAALARFAITQHAAGHKHIWAVPLSRYTPNASAGVGRDSEFLQFERVEKLEWST